MGLICFCGSESLKSLEKGVRGKDLATTTRKALTKEI